MTGFMGCCLLPPPHPRTNCLELDLTYTFDSGHMTPSKKIDTLAKMKFDGQAAMGRQAMV